MANKIVIAELDIDTDELLKSTADLKKEIDAIKNKQKELTKSGQATSEEFVQNAADLKALSNAYNQNIKAISQNTQAQADQAVRLDLIALALDNEVTSITEAREANKVLNKLRNEANATTAEGQEEIRKLNNALDANNAFIKENSDAYLKQKINIGNYKDSIIEAFEEMEKNKQALVEEQKALVQLRDETEKGSESWIYYNNQVNQTNTQINILSVSMGEMNDEANASASITKLLSGNFSGLAQDAEKVGGANNLMSSSLKGAASGMMGMVKASLAFIATPVGAIIAALVLVFALVKNAMNRSEEATNKITKVFTIFSGIVGKLLSFLEPLGEFLIDGIVKGFELAGQAAETALDIISGGLALLGFDDASKGVADFKNEMKTASIEAGKLADAEARLEKEQRKSQLTQLEYQKNAEKLRQIRDNENLTIKERIKANEDLGLVLKQQLNDELKIAQLALEVANQRIKAEGQTKEALDRQAEALTTIADIQERITGQESEQLTNRVSLQKEAAEKAKEIREKALQDVLDKSKQEIDLFIANQGFKRKSSEEEYIFNKQLQRKELADLELRYKNGKISKLEYETEKLNITNDFAKKNAELFLQNAELELQIIQSKNDKILESDKFLNDELLKQKQEALNSQLIADQEFQNKKLEQGTINEQEYNTAINQINEENRVKLAELEEERKLADVEKRLLDIDLRREAEALTFEEDLALKLERLAIEKEKELENAEKTGADKDLITQKYANSEKQIRQAVELAKLDLVSNGLSQAKGLLKENTLAYKALAIAEATINTYKAASLALSTYAYPVGGIFAGLAIGQGLLQVSKIAGVKGFDGGGEVGRLGNGVINNGANLSIPLNSGDDTLAYVKQGEVILNKEQQSRAGGTSFFRSIGVPGFATGGLIGSSQNSSIITQSVRPQEININSVVEAIQNMPAPRVAVDEIQSVGTQYVKVQSMADN